MKINPLLLTDVYKLGHMVQYPDDTSYVYSYLEARKPGNCLFFGLQYILKEYLEQPITKDNVDEFLKYYNSVLGSVPSDVVDKVNRLAKLGYWPIEIKAVKEGSIVDNKNVLMTIVNTHPEFYWCVGFLESLLLKIWNPCTVATYSLKYYNLVKKFADLTCDNDSHIAFQVHDFGYRGVSSEESAMISGSAHLLNFFGSDTITANLFLDKYYLAKNDVKGLSVPASEHSVMCAYGRNNEYKAFDRMLELHPKGIVSIVSDSYDYWQIMTDYIESRKSKILERDGKCVFRPDSGDPVKIICGDPDIDDKNSPAYLGSLRLLEKTFGSTKNAKGYKVLNPKVGLIYGDGMYYERFVEMLEKMQNLGFASSNIVIGVGGLLLQQHSRDEMGFAIKATWIKNNKGQAFEIFKDPATDKGKKSKVGLMALKKNSDGSYFTVDKLQENQDNDSLLIPVYKNGKCIKEYSFKDIKNTVKIENENIRLALAK